MAGWNLQSYGWEHFGITSLGVECAGADFVILDMKDVYHSRNQNRKKLISLKFILHSQDLLPRAHNLYHTLQLMPTLERWWKVLSYKFQIQKQLLPWNRWKMQFFWQDSNPLKCNALSSNIRISSCAFNAGNYATSWFKIFNNSNGYWVTWGRMRLISE